MSENELKKILDENRRLQEEAEATKNIKKVSEAAASIMDYAQKTEDPLRDSSQTNPFTAKTGQSCDLL